MCFLNFYELYETFLVPIKFKLYFRPRRSHCANILCVLNVNESLSFSLCLLFCECVLMFCNEAKWSGDDAEILPSWWADPDTNSCACDSCTLLLSLTITNHKINRSEFVFSQKRRPCTQVWLESARKLNCFGLSCFKTRKHVYGDHAQNTSLFGITLYSPPQLNIQYKTTNNIFTLLQRTINK